MEGRALTLIEFVLVVCVILVLAGTFAFYAQVTLRIAREQALQNELANIRMSIQHYLIVKKQIPPDLTSLMNQGLTITGPSGIILQKKFLEPFRVDKAGYLVDPFGRRYNYDCSSGRVNSSTPGYEAW